MATSTPAQQAPGGRFRHDHEWRDWRLEWLLEVGTLYLRMRACRDEAVLTRLRPLAEARPATEADWLALGARIRVVEHDLAEQGKLPAFYFPG
jgi:hypothetical protein